MVKVNDFPENSIFHMQPNTRFHVKWFPEIVFSQNNTALITKLPPPNFLPILGWKLFCEPGENNRPHHHFPLFPSQPNTLQKVLSLSLSLSLSPKIHSTKHTLRLPSHDKQKLCKEMVDKGGLTIIYSIHMWLEVLFGKKLITLKNNITYLDLNS